jgi:hypothetical protein
MTTTHRTLPVAVIGAGPVGLAAAAHLATRGQAFVVVEAGSAVGAHVRAWSHVRVFSPWRFNVDPAAVALLEHTGWTMPDPDALPTGAELVARYLEPLAALPAIRPHVALDTRVVSVTRRGLDKLKTAGRAEAPFALRVRGPGGEADLLARAVIDASGTWGAPNPLGASGVPARGEAAAADRVFYGIPDVLGTHRPRYAGRRVLVVGSGHSAFNTILDLADLAAVEPATLITWLARRQPDRQMLGGGADDALPARGALGGRIGTLVQTGAVRLVVGRLAAVSRTAVGVAVLDEAGLPLAEADEIVAVTGFRPDLGLTRELRLDLEPTVEASTALAPLIDPNVHSCGTVPPHGVEELRHPEPDFYCVGMKSYGRAPTFLMLTGYEQVRSVVAALAGDWAAAREVRLVLPETGVCGSDLAAEVAGSACCGTAAPEPVAAVAGAPPITRGEASARRTLALVPPRSPGSCC